MTPVVSAAEDEVGVIWTIESSGTEVWSPATSRIVGERLFTPAPLQSVIWIFTGSTWPFFSLFVTGVFVTGGRNAPVPTPTVIVFVSEPPSLSVIFTVPVWLHPADVYWCDCVKLWASVCDAEPSEPVVFWLKVVCAEASPQFTSTAHGASGPGSANEPRLKFVLAPSVELWSAGAVTVGGTLATLALKVAWPEPPSLSVTFTVTV